MTAQPLPPEELPYTPSNHAPRVNTRPSSAVACARCDAWWSGLNSAHCGACHRTFTSVRAFDIHRRGGKCINPADVRTRKGEPALVPANKLWPGWSEPGTWDGPAE